MHTSRFSLNIAPENTNQRDDKCCVLWNKLVSKMHVFPSQKVTDESELGPIRSCVKKHYRVTSLRSNAYLSRLLQ